MRAHLRTTAPAALSFLTLAGVLVAGQVPAHAQAQAQAQAQTPQARQGGAFTAAAEAGPDTALTGHLLRDGQPIVGDLAVMIWPKAEELAKLPLGSKVDTQIIYRGKSAADGSFAIPVDPSTLPAEYVANAGQVDLSLTVADATQQADWSTSVVRAEQTDAGKVAARAEGELAPEGWTTTASVAGGSTAVESVTLDLGEQSADSSDQPLAQQETESGLSVARALKTGQTSEADQAPTLAVEPRSDQLMNQPVASFAAKTVRAQAEPADPADVCVTFSSNDVKNRLEHFARVYGWSGAKGMVEFSSGSAHSLGVANGGDTKWTASGTSGISSDAGATATGLIDAETKNRVNYRDYKNLCWSTTHRRPLSFNALLPGGDFGKTAHKNFSECDPYNAGQTVWKSKGKNVTYTAGVALPYLNVQAQSGWTVSTKVGFDVKKKSYVCGSTSDGWAHSPQVSVKKRS